MEPHWLFTIRLRSERMGRWYTARWPATAENIAKLCGEIIAKDRHISGVPFENHGFAD